MSMHRFVDFRSIGHDLGEEVHARLALRADGALWLLGDVENPILVDRGSGWIAAARLCLCVGDRVRLGKRELSPDELCRLAAIDPADLVPGPAIASELPGITAPVPLMLRGTVVDNARRDPGTGQIRPQFKVEQ